MKTNEPLAWLACLALLYSLPQLSADELAVVKEGRVNVRGQPSLAGEVITQLQQGEKVIVLEEVASTRAKTNEPAKWARIQMPANTPVWVYAPMIDLASKSVKVPRLNLRGGPGENFSVVGRLTRGATVTEIRRVEDWMEIETPPSAYGFVAANLLAKPEAGPAPAVASQQPAQPAPVVPAPTEALKPAVPTPQNPNAPTVAAQAQPPMVITPSAPAPAVEKTEPIPAPAVKNPLAQTKAELQPPPLAEPPVVAQPLASAPSTVAEQPPVYTAAKPKPEEGPIRRVVRREGLVRSTTSIQAPTYYELLNPDNRKTINYLHADKLGVNLKDYRGRRIVVTGEEAIDPRWPKTPVIDVETLELIP
jgi:hypothetical protein